MSRTPTRIVAHLATVLAAVGFVVLGGVAAPAIAAPAPVAAQTLRIVDSTGAPLPGAAVSLQTAPFEPEHRALAGANGVVDLSTIAGVQVGVSYQVFVWANGYTGYWDLAPDAGTTQPITVTVPSGTVTSQVPFTNPPPDATTAGVRGTVTDALTGLPIFGAQVGVNDDGNQGIASGGGQTLADGTYYVAVTGNLPNTVRVLFTTLVTTPDAPYGYGVQSYDGVEAWQPLPENPVPVAANTTASTIDAALIPNGRLTGRVTRVSGSTVTPVQGDVQVWDPQAGVVIASGPLASDGTYAFPVPPGTWIVEFDEIANGQITDRQFYRGAATYETAGRVTVAAALSTDGIDAQFGTAPVTPVTPAAPGGGAVLPATGLASSAWLPLLGGGAVLLGAALWMLAQRSPRARRQP